MPLEEFDCRCGPGRGLFVGQPALRATGEDFGGSSAGRLDQSAAFLKRQPPERRQILVKQRCFRNGQAVCSKREERRYATLPSGAAHDDS